MPWFESTLGIRLLFLKLTKNVIECAINIAKSTLEIKKRSTQYFLENRNKISLLLFINLLKLNTSITELITKHDDMAYN